tara:strand:+ start:154 stop:1365 length:1212 start_codon:yes stop_codon:yes gene_type:complete
MTNTNKIEYAQDTDGIGFDIDLYVDGKPIIWKNINEFTIKESVYAFIPRLEMSFLDDGFFTEHNPILEGQVVEVTISTNKETSPYVKQKFMVLSTNALPTSHTNDRFIINIIGILNAPGLINGIKSKSFPANKFSEVAKSIASQNGLSFDARLESSDKMNWYQLNQTDNDFMNNSIYRSYVADDDVPFCFINRSGTVVYTSLKTESKSPSEFILVKDNLKGNDKIVPGGIERFYTSHSYSDKSGLINTLCGGYGTKLSHYDGNKIVTEDITTMAFSELTTYRNKLKDNYDKFTNSTMKFGTLNNVYTNYFKSIVNNDLVRKSLFSTSLIINAQANNYQLFDKINIEVKLGNDLIKSQSGNYIIGSIIHNLNKKGKYNQLLVCFRDGVGTNNTTVVFNNPLKDG